MTRLMQIAVLFLGMGLGGCQASTPDVIPRPSGLPDAGGSSYAEIVVSYTDTSGLVTCSDSIPEPCQQSSGPCAGHAVIGAPDDVRFEMRGEAQLEVGFLCRAIVDRAYNSEIGPDFRVIARVEEGGGAVVSVSENGSDFIVLGNLVREDQGFDLSAQGLDFARFVRITSSSGSILSIDAVEALP